MVTAKSANRRRLESARNVGAPGEPAVDALGCRASVDRDTDSQVDQGADVSEDRVDAGVRRNRANSDENGCVVTQAVGMVLLHHVGRE
jgi:hypothetical protein